jgi:hypothetical protein
MDNYISFEEGQQYIPKRDRTSNTYITTLGPFREMGLSPIENLCK